MVMLLDSVLFLVNLKNDFQNFDSPEKKTCYNFAFGCILVVSRGKKLITDKRNTQLTRRKPPSLPRLYQKEATQINFNEMKKKKKSDFYY